MFFVVGDFALCFGGRGGAMSAGVYLVKRGPRPPYHRAPFHPVIICGKVKVAKWEAGSSRSASSVWEHERPHRGGGWLFARWKGFDIDYGGVVSSLTLPDGDEAAFVHEHTGREPWTLLAGAVWWDDKKIPAWLADAGVVYPPDSFTQQRILDDIASDGCSGFGRARPAHWPEPIEVELEPTPRNAKPDTPVLPGTTEACE